MASISRRRSAGKSSDTPTARDLNRARVAVYCRVSSDEQAQAGTIQNQVGFARRYCDLHALPIADIYADEGVSGTVPLAERPQGARLLADAQAGRFGTVLVYRIDRLARSTRILLEAHDALKANGVALRSMTEPFDTSSPLGEFIMTLLGSLAALERATILERMSLGKHRAAREGRWLGGAPPFGYRVEGPEHDRRLVVHPEEAAVVRRIFHLYVHEGMGLIPIMELLNAEGVPSPYASRGTKTERWPEQERRWNSGTLSRLLRNTAYVGRYRAGAQSGKEIAEYETPRIVDDETFAAAQRLLGERFIEATRTPAASTCSAASSAATAAGLSSATAATPTSSTITLVPRGSTSASAPRCWRRPSSTTSRSGRGTLARSSSSCGDGSANGWSRPATPPRSWRASENRSPPRSASKTP